MSDSQVDRPLRSVFVGNIPYEVTEEKLKEIFSEVGPVLSMKLVYDRESGKPKGYGFCEYKDVETAMSAMRNLNGFEINGRILRVDNAGAERHRMAEMNSGGGGGGVGGGGQGQGNGPRHVEEQQQHPFMMGRGSGGGGGGERDRDREQDGPPPPEKTPEVISKAVASLPPEQMFELMKQMKLCIQNNPNEARTMLLQNPQLAYALLQAQVVMKIIDPAAALAMLHQDNGVAIGNLLPEGQTGGMMMGSGPRPGFGVTQQQSENPWITAAASTGAPLMPINPPGPFGQAQPLGASNAGTGGDLDFRQMQMDLRIRNPPPPTHQDLDLRNDLRNQDRFQMDPRHRGDRDLRDTDRDMRMGQGRDRGMRDSDLRGDRDLRDPRMQQNVMMMTSDPRARARAEREQQLQAQAQVQKVAATALPPGMAAGFGPGTTDTEKAALIMQVLQLSDEQISMLPPEQRQSILVLKEQINLNLKK